MSVSHVRCFQNVFNCTVHSVTCPSWGYFDQNNGYFVFCQEGHSMCVCQCGHNGPFISAILGICNTSTSQSAEAYLLPSITDSTLNDLLNQSSSKIARQRYEELVYKVREHKRRLQSASSKPSPSPSPIFHRVQYLGDIPFRVQYDLRYYANGFASALLKDPFRVSGSTIAAISLAVLVLLVPPVLYLYRKPRAARNNSGHINAKTVSKSSQDVTHI
ncbi:hypothetical protein CAPTEDRAFT_205485 [Capitella teleta]|uniref:Uncharacterized protein n=1 Tax=Capitella teleta TaxID=283909 RepID=R7UPS5_CAPTE|nr:hypothetical protein CAPTEDRAFT_205485 [Capitella teleta]|eukprot:ELU05431.1 hypothetical protein CAPTEDRAFT_205485 [Capitella teleta]